MKANQDQEAAIRVRGLQKSYKTLEVLRGVDFDVAPGGIFALLGSNGAGKTTEVLDIAMSLIGDPPILFLDEPTTGLDPTGRLRVWETIKGLAEGARRCCSRPSISTRPSNSPTRLPSSTRAGSSSTAPLVN